MLGKSEITGLPPSSPRVAPTFTVVSGATITIHGGQTATAELEFKVQPIAVFKYNVSAGAPPGVTATLSPISFTFNGSRNSGVLTQKITLTLAAAKTAPAVITKILVGIAMNGSTTVLYSASIDFTIPAYMQIGASGDQQNSGSAVSLAAFGVGGRDLNFQIANGVSPVAFTFKNALPPGVTGTINPAKVTLPGGGYQAVSISFSAGAMITPQTSTVIVAATVGSEERLTYSFPLNLRVPFVSALNPTSGAVPMFGNAGTQVTVYGGGFAPGATVAFGADAPVAAQSVAANGTSLVVVVPPTAASGPVTVTSSSGSAAGASFAVYNYRNTRGFMALNNDVQQAAGGSYSYDDTRALFGASQTDWTIPIINVSFESPLCWAFRQIADALLGVGGQCFGMSLASLRCVSGQQQYVNFPQQPAAQLEPNGPAGPDVWQLAGPPPDNPSPLTSYIHQQHLAQLSVESLFNWINIHSGAWTAADLRTRVQNALAKGVGAMIAINPSLGEGHVVVAYQLVDRGSGNFDILVYNCNTPFSVGEDASSTARAGAAANSVIHVASDGTWTLPELPGFTGGMSGITPILWGTIPNPPTAPFSLEAIAALVAAGVALAASGLLLWIVTGTASVGQISDGQGHTLLANNEWNLDPKTALTGAAPIPSFGGLNKIMPTGFFANRSGTLVHAITGKATGTYNFNWVGGNHALALSGVLTMAGDDDTIVTDPAGSTVEFTPRSQKAVKLTITGVGTVSKIPRTATLTTTASANGTIHFSFDAAAESFAYTHDGGATTYTLALLSYDASGKPTTYTTTAAPVASGDTLTIAPDWTRLAAVPGGVTIRSADGAVSSRSLT